MIFNLDPSPGGSMREEQIHFDGAYLFAQEGKTWELALLESGTLRFQGSPGLVDIFLVGGGKPGNLGSGSSTGGSGGSGGECKLLEGLRLRRGTDYAVTVGGSGEATGLNGGGLRLESASGGGSAGGSGAAVTTTGRYGVALAGADGVYAFDEEETLLYPGRRYGAGGGGAEASAGSGSSAIHSNSRSRGGSNAGGDTGGGTGGNTSSTGTGNASAGAANTGAGGGGAWRRSDSNGVPGAGGSGIILIRGRGREALVERTASGNPIAITDGGSGAAIRSLTVTVTPQQAGDGTPSLANPRALSGYDSFTLSRSEDGLNVSEDLGSAGTVYAGALDLITGTLTVTHSILSLRVADMNNNENYPGWTNAGIKELVGAGQNSQIEIAASNVKTAPFGVYANTNGNNDIVYLSRSTWGVTSQSQFKADYPELTVQLLIELPEPRRYTLAAHALDTLYGANTFRSSAGSMEITYRASAALAAKEVKV